MFPKKSALTTALAAVAVLISFKSFSQGNQYENASTLVDANAFDSQWSGEYYAEPEEAEAPRFRSFEEKREVYLNSPEIGTEEVEVDENGNPIGRPEPSVATGLPQPGPSPSIRPWFVPLRNPWDLTNGDEPFSFIKPIPKPSAIAPSPLPSAIPSGKPQAFFYYNQGSLKNGSEIESEGKGFVKVFRDRDEATGGRGWGTRALIGLIRQMASDFADKYPGRERLQIADIARKTGGKMAHGSHQNGLDADIVYIRKNHKEQSPFGGYGKNGFAEQFVVRTSTIRKTKDANGQPKSVKVYSLVPSANFDTEANFNLLLMFHRSGEVKTYFVDKVLIRELFRYAEAKHLSNDPEVKAMLMKLDYEPSHADHFHVRLFCQDGDSKCYSENAPARKRVSSPPPKKRAAK
ncbi:MAG: penicillin-insensitive murein endopeptidase [Bdellovibrionales bacterium]|nr:penicillin-insensitive murein endopeptidase [Bdellovibrionales bacterium]